MKEIVRLSKENREGLMKINPNANSAIASLLARNISEVTIDYEKIKEKCAEAISEAR